MMKTIGRILAGMLVVALFAAPAIGQGNYYFFQVQNEYGEPFTTDGFVGCSVYSTGANGGNTTAVTHSAASLDFGTGQAGPLFSSTNGIIHWYSSSKNPVDVVCYTKAGDTGRKSQMRITDHRLRIDTSGMDKVVRFPFSTNTSPTSTGIYVPQGALVTGVAVQVATPGATVAHINVGFGGNHAYALRNALANQLQAGPNTLSASAGFNTYMNFTGQPGATWPGGGVQAGPASINHYGLLLRHVSVLSASGGTGAGTYNGGVLVHTTGGLELTYDTSNVAVVGGHVYVFFRTLHVGGAAGY